MKPTPAPATDEQRFAVILGELADALTDKKRQIAELLPAARRDRVPT